MTLRKNFLLVFFVVLAVSAKSVRAERRGDEGIGLMLGNPSGLSGKMWIDENVALDAAFGVDRGDTDIHASLLFHKFNWSNKSPIVPVSMQEADERGELPVYFGFGPRLIFRDDNEFGLRFPLGISYLPKTTPWEFFFEVAPVLRITQEVGFNGDFAIGARYYFKAIRPQGTR